MEKGPREQIIQGLFAHFYAQVILLLGPLSLIQVAKKRSSLIDRA